MTDSTGGVEAGQATVTELASQIDKHLKRFEADPEINVAGGYGRPYYAAGAFRAGAYVKVRYVAYQGGANLRRDEAERYLAWLDAGNVGPHYEAFRVSL